MTRRTIFLSVVSVATLFFAVPAFAALVPSECLGSAPPSSCNLQSMVSALVMFANYLFGISGSLALLFFTYGGLKWIMSHGNADAVKEGKTIITNATIGMFILFGASGLIHYAENFATNLHAVGGSCTDKLNPVAPADRGIINPRWMQPVDGGDLVCVSSCDQLASISKLKYSCTPLADSSGKRCVKNLCGGTDVCCINTPVTETTDTGAKSCSCQFSGVDNQSLIIDNVNSPDNGCGNIQCAPSEGGDGCDCNGTYFPIDVKQYENIARCRATICTPTVLTQ